MRKSKLQEICGEFGNDLMRAHNLTEKARKISNIAVIVSVIVAAIGMAFVYNM